MMGRGGIGVRGAILFAAALTMGAAPPVETVEVKTPRAKVEADDGTGLFVIGQDNYVFAKVGNPKRQVIAYDPVKRRVRISALDRDPMWIQCGYLEPSKSACAASTAAPAPKGFRLATPSPEATAPATKGFRLAAPSGKTTPKASAASPMKRTRTGAVRSIGAETAPAALPDCPGDPRCP